MPPNLLDTFKERFSAARLEPYERAVDNDPQMAVALYDWNIQIGSAFFEDISVVEVLLRNALDKALRKQHQANDEDPWYEQSDILLQAQYDAVDGAMAHLDDGYGHPGQDDVISALPLGFWRNLLGPGYQTRLWPTLKEAFHYVRPGNTIKRADMYEHVSDVHDLRNGIAHHDPIFDWDFMTCVDNLRRIAEPICPKTYGWMNARSRVDKLLAADPRRTGWSSDE